MDLDESSQARACVNLPVSLGWSREEIKEVLPFLEDSQIEEIISAAYELQVTFDLGLKKFVSVKTVTHYTKREMCPKCDLPATYPSGLCRDCHQASLEVL